MRIYISFISIIMAGLSFQGCGCGQSTGQRKDGAVSVDTIQPRTVVTTAEPARDDSIFTISFSESNQHTIRGKLGSHGPAIVCNFSINKPQSLTAVITPDIPDCNIRISQIVMPGKKTDGPFGRELKYRLPRKGRYQLIIDHNMMAGDPEVCEFNMKLSVF